MRIPIGDVDGRVTVRDVLIETLAVLLGRREPRFDINRDGRVALDDLGIIVRQLGRSCTAAARWTPGP